MFCEECGTKNVEGSVFCENCGHKFEIKNIEPIKKKPIKLGWKAYLIIGIIILAIIAYFVGKHFTDPKFIAEDYFKTVMNVDVDKMYGYLGATDSEFTSKEMFKKIIGEVDKKDIPKLINYTIGKLEKSADGMTATVKITYLLNGDTESETKTITLIKEKSNKFLIYDNWKIKQNDYYIVKNFKMEIMKGGTIEIEGVKLDSKYLKNEECTDKLDIYEIPEIFGTYYDAKIVLPAGIEIEETLFANTISRYRLKYLDTSNINDATKTKIISKSKEAVQQIYNGIIEGKTWDNIKSTFEIQNLDVSEVKKTYEALLNTLSTASTKLTSINFNKLEIFSIDIEDDNVFELGLKGEYNYSITYLDGEETKTKNSSSEDNFYVIFEYLNGELYISDITGLNTYFSKY